MPADWERPIFFEGVELHGVMIAVDHLGLYDNLPEMSEETSIWLWRFTICVGVIREDSSASVVNAVSETLELIQRFRGRLLKTLPDHYPGFQEEVLEAWRQSLEQILCLAEERAHCKWQSPLLPTDPPKWLGRT